MTFAERPSIPQIAAGSPEIGRIRLDAGLWSSSQHAKGQDREALAAVVRAEK